MTHRRRHTEGLPDNANPNAVNALIRAEIARMDVRFLRRGVDTSMVNIATIEAHVAEAVGQGTADEKPTENPDGSVKNNCRKHWRLSTLEFLVDDADSITHFICVVIKTSSS